MKTELRYLMMEACVRRVHWAADKGDEPLWSNGPTAKEYVEGLVRKPGMGSYVKQKLADHDRDGVYFDEAKEFKSIDDVIRLMMLCDFIDITDRLPTAVKRPGYQYYRGTPDSVWPNIKYELWQDVVPLTSFAVTQDEADADTFRNRALYVVEGPHGLELRAANRNEPVLVDHITVITDDDGLATWHPGYPAAPIDFVNAVVKYT